MVNQERILFIFHDEQSSRTKHRAAHCEISFLFGLTHTLVEYTQGRIYQ